MALDMRALYYVSFDTGMEEKRDRQLYEESVKSNENFLNQNFSILTEKLYELESRLSAVEP